ncbi:MAG: imidazolonepropionase, partial [Pseudomonadota bacterium]
MDGVLFGSTLATMTDSGRYGLVDNGAVAFQDGTITFAGQAADLPGDAPGPRHDFGDRLITPGLVDCHTHIVHGGNRAGEFEMRLEGASYEQVQKAGGGILSTMRATREASEDALLASALPRVDHLLAEGVTSLEIKSGYGLSIAHELKMLRAARRIEDERPVRVVTSYLAAHALPPEYTDNDLYIDEVVLPGLDQAAEEGLVDA